MDVETDDHRLPMLRTLGLPCVLIGLPDETGGLACVDLDFRQAAALCVEHLAALGHRHICLLGSAPAVYQRHSSYALAFEAGFEAAVARRGVVGRWYPTEPDYERASAVVERELHQHPETTALLVHNEAVLGAVLSTLRRLGRRVPDDISVVAICPDEMATNQSIPLTGVAVPADQMGRLAVEMVLSQLDGNPATGHTWSPRDSPSARAPRRHRDAPSGTAPRRRLEKDRAMKFNNGYWLLRDGATARYATQVFDTRSDDRSASVAVLCDRIENRGSVLNTPTITVDLSSPMPGVVRVTASHFRPVAPPSVAFDLDEAPGPVQVERTSERLRLTSGPVTVEAALAGPWELMFAGDGEALTGSGVKSLSSMSVADDGDYMVERLTLPVGAHVYGLGERFAPFVKNGQTVDIWNEDGGTVERAGLQEHPVLPDRPRATACSSTPRPRLVRGRLRGGLARPVLAYRARRSTTS